MARIVVFTATVAGHNMEYLHHIYDVAIHRCENQYVFVVPASFEQVKHNMTWPQADHIRFDYITNEEVATFQSKGMLASSYNMCKIVRNRLKKHHADKLFVVTLMSHLPFAPFMYGCHVKMSGVIYKIYLYEWKRASFLRRVSDVVKYQLLVRFPLFEHLYLLNDEPAVRRINRAYRSTKFRPLVDPYTPIEQPKRQNLRQAFLCRKEDKLFIHFGAMDARKGTLEILDSLALLDEKQRERYCFVFAGRVAPAIKEEFYRRVEQLKSRVRIYVKDEFCSYDYLASLCEACDALVIPYLETAQSSGVIGYASQFQKPVIAPKRGLVGKLVRRYKLGVTTDVTSEGLLAAYRIIETSSPSITTEYVATHQVMTFQQQLSESL